MNVTKFDKPTCKILGATISETLENLGKEFGVKFTYKGGTFDPNSFTFKIVADVINPETGTNEKDLQMFKMYAASYDLSPDDFHKVIRIKRGMFKIIGIAPQSYKYPILLQNVETGKVWKYPATVVKAAISGTIFGYVAPQNMESMETHYED